MPDIIGTSGNDVLNGTPGDDLIQTLGGSDTTTAGDGNDVIAVISQLTPYGTIDGGNGIDTLRIDRALSPLVSNGPTGVDTVSIAVLQSAVFTSIERIAFNSNVGELFSAVFNYGGNGGATNQFGSGISPTAELVGGAGTDVLTLQFNSNGLAGTVTLPNFNYTNWSTGTQPFLNSDRINISVQGSGNTTINITSHAGVVGVTGGTGNDVANGSEGMESFNGNGTGTDTYFGNGGSDMMTVINSYMMTNGVPGSETTFTGAGMTFDGGDGFDWLAFGGHVTFLGAATNVEGIALSPDYANPNFNPGPVRAGSQYPTSLTISNSVLSGLIPNLLFKGVGDITIVVGGGQTFNGSAYTFDGASAINVFVNGDSQANSITGTIQGDTIDGSGGADSVFAGAGDDAVFLYSGSVVLDGGAGIDNLFVNTNAVASGTITGFEALTLANGNVTFTGTQFASALVYNSVLAGVGSITVNLEAGVRFFGTAMTVVNGSSLTMVINGGAGIDAIKAVLGVSNELHGGDSTDQIRGGNLADLLDGGNGNDKLMGLSGADLLIGGAGSDQFRYLFRTDSGVGAGNRDVIQDFLSGTDKIDFRGLDADPVASGRQTLSFAGNSAFHATGAGEVRYEMSGSDLLIQVDLDGNGTTDMEMLLLNAGTQTLAGTDFLF